MDDAADNAKRADSGKFSALVLDGSEFSDDG